MQPDRPGGLRRPRAFENKALPHGRAACFHAPSHWPRSRAAALSLVHGVDHQAVGDDAAFGRAGRGGGRGGGGAPYLTGEMHRRIKDEIIPRYETRLACLLPALHLVQHEYGWIPRGPR
jgi:hypothetical protein